jgi:hypothetical protein
MDRQPTGSYPAKLQIKLSSPGKRLPYISNNVGPVKHFLSRLLHLLKRVFSSASLAVFLFGLDDGTTLYSTPCPVSSCPAYNSDAKAVYETRYQALLS